MNPLLSRLIPRSLFRKGRPRLVLHVGTHKTGTTSIQSALRESRETLRAARICYPDPNREPFPELPAHNFIYSAMMNGPKAMAAERARIMAEFRAARADCLILSEECLGLPLDEIQEFFDPWRETFDITIVCFLRRQDRYAESLFSQYVRERRDIAAGTIADFLAVPKIAARFDYDTNLKRWDDFGPVHAVNYDQFKGDTLHVPVLQAAGTNLGITPPPRTNVSPRTGVIEVIRHLNRAGHDYDLDALLEHLRNDPPAALREMLARRGMMGSTLRRDFIAGLEEANTRLAQNRAVVFDNRMPDEPAQMFHTPLEAEMIGTLARLCS
ncbi:hypothetical protein [Sulfitobacter sp.]|uniref:hypothetical protein n=1 Tax=Sulfitobacter sp. TaxID=1903071 RepID=UPI003EF3A9C0